jgi:5,10-methenyltetrahydromethanopterin hydrogenase
MEPAVILAAKAAVPVVTAVGGAVVAITTENVTVGTTLAVLAGLAGMFVQNQLKSQKAVWTIVQQKDADIEDLRDENHHLNWRLLVALFRLGEVADPGQYVPRPRRHHADPPR